MSKKRKLKEALTLLADLGLPRQQINERTALCLLALIDMKPASAWSAAGAPLLGITPIMDWAAAHYGATVTSHGPVDAKRQIELAQIFANSTAGLVYVSAFSSRKTFLRYLDVIAWESEVWIADAPTHMIHFNGSRFLGPY